MIILNFSHIYSKSIINKLLQRNILPLIYSKQYCNSSDNYWINSTNTEEVEIKFKEKNILKISTGKLARFADGAAVVSAGETHVMMTAVSQSKAETNSFLPLTVDYRQKAAAAGRIPTNYLRREIGVSDREVLTSRMIDRSVRPLFPNGYLFNTQLVSNVLSMDGENYSDIVAINAASAALALSDIPWDGPIGAVRIGFVDGDLVVNPTRLQMLNSSLDLIVTGCEKNKVVMLEASADDIDQPTFMAAIKAGVKATSTIVEAIQQLSKRMGRTKRDWIKPSTDLSEEQKEIIELINSLSNLPLRKEFMDSTHHKFSRDRATQAIRQQVISCIMDSYPSCDRGFVSDAFSSFLKSTFRDLIFENKTRCDGRSLFDLRNIACDVDLYKPLHGSAMFQRGQTQVLGTVTFDSLDSAAKIDNFPPYATNETGRTGGTGRRELGHGALAEKALRPVVPSESPFTIRVTAEVLESNGYWLRIFVYGFSLCWKSGSNGCRLDIKANLPTSVFGVEPILYSVHDEEAMRCLVYPTPHVEGVPVSDAVAGVAIGLITRTDDTDTQEIKDYLILTDLLGIEDYLGDMDFKMAGTHRGITALQADIKLRGLPLSIIMETVTRATEARKRILNIMNSTLRSPRTNKGDKMPVSEKLNIPAQKRGQFVGVGGHNLKRLQQRTGVTLSHVEDNIFQLFAPNRQAYAEAMAEVEELLTTKREPDLEFGAIYKSTVTEIRDNGVMVQLYESMPPALIPNSQLDQRKVSHASALDITVGQDLSVKYFGRDPATGRLRLSRKALFGATTIARDLMKR